MPTVFTRVTSNQSRYLSLSLDSNNTQIIDTDAYRNITKKVNKQNGNTYFLMSIPEEYEHLTLMSSILAPLYLLLSIACFNRTIAEDNYSFVNLALGTLSFTMTCITQITNTYLLNDIAKYKENQAEDIKSHHNHIKSIDIINDKILSDVSLSTGNKLPFSQYYCFTTHFLKDTDYKVILPKRIKDHHLESSKLKIDDKISIHVSVKIGNTIISKFINTKIEFNDRIKDCAFLSMGNDLNYEIANDLYAFISANQSFPIVCQGNEYIAANEFPDTIKAMSAEQTFGNDQMEEIAALLSTGK